MTFLWFVGPVAVVIIYLLTTSRDKRRAVEADAWAAAQRVKRVNAVPSMLSGMIEDIGAGAPVRIFEIIPKAAYLGIYEANALSGSDHQTVFLLLEEAGPACTIRPLPIVDGNPITNVGVQFGKHKAFMDNFLVEGENAAAIKRWLTRPLRKALLELTDVWVRVDGKQMAVTLYGTTYTPRPPAEEPTSGAATTVYRAASARTAPAPAVLDSMRLQELVTTADALFAEYGAAGAPSLLLEDDRDDDADGGDDDAEEPAFHPPPKPEATKPAAKPEAAKPEAAKPAAAPKPASKPAPEAAAKPSTSGAEATKSGPVKAVKVAAAVPRSPASISKSPSPSKPSKR